MATITVTPNSAAPGQNVNVDGANFDPKFKFTLETVDKNGIAVGQTSNINRPRPDGTFKVGINVPPLEGPSAIRAYQQGTLVATAPVSVKKPVITPPPPSTGYDAEFRPSSSDETARFENFLRQTAGKKRAVYGDIPVTYVTGSLTGGTLDFNDGAMLHAIDDRAQATFGLFQCFDVVINRAKVKGRGYGTYHPNYQWQHGIGVYGGKNIQLLDMVTTDNYGDGIDVDVMGSEATPLGIVIARPKITRSCRNNITLNAGQVTVTDFDLSHAGLHNIDMEPNGDREALSIDVTILNGQLTTHDDMKVFDTPGEDITGFAIAGGGYSHATKKRVDIQKVKADRFTMMIGFIGSAVFKSNESVTPVVCNNGGSCPDTCFIDRAKSLDLGPAGSNKNMTINTVYQIF